MENEGRRLDRYSVLESDIEAELQSVSDDEHFLPKSYESIMIRLTILIIRILMHIASKN